jgi:hypothetical protein
MGFQDVERIHLVQVRGTGPALVNTEMDLCFRERCRRG